MHNTSYSCIETCVVSPELGPSGKHSAFDFSGVETDKLSNRMPWIYLAISFALCCKTRRKIRSVSAAKLVLAISSWKQQLSALFFSNFFYQMFSLLTMASKSGWVMEPLLLQEVASCRNCNKSDSVNSSSLSLFQNQSAVLSSCCNRQYQSTVFGSASSKLLSLGKEQSWLAKFNCFGVLANQMLCTTCSFHILL